MFTWREPKLVCASVCGLLFGFNSVRATEEKGNNAGSDLWLSS